MPAGKRRTVLREYLEAMQALWSQEEASYDGEFVSFGASWAWPKPVQQPRVPIMVGAGGTEKTFAWIARSADGWLTTPGETDLDGKVALLHQAWREAGRDGPPQVTVLAGKPDPDVLAHWARDRRDRRGVRHAGPRRRTRSSATSAGWPAGSGLARAGADPVPAA